jgi:hypothetical protein
MRPAFVSVLRHLCAVFLTLNFRFISLIKRTIPLKMLIHILKHKKWIFAIAVGLCFLFAGSEVFSIWNVSMTNGLMGNAEQASITNIRFVQGDPSGDTIKVTVRNSGTITIAIAKGYANGIKCINIATGQAIIIQKEKTQEITLTYPNRTFVLGTEYRVNLVTAKGTSIVKSLTYNSTYTSQYNPSKDSVGPTPSTYHTNTYQEQSSTWAKWIFTFLVLTVIANVGACLLANHVFQPRKRGQLFILLFLVTVVVVFTMLIITFSVFFPPLTVG